VAIVFNEHTDEDGATVFRHACKMFLNKLAIDTNTTAGNAFSASTAVGPCEKEADHLAASIWPPCVGIGSGWAAARPGVTEAMNEPLLQDVVAGCIGIVTSGANLTEIHRFEFA
jgi:hypothetical protein